MANEFGKKLKQIRLQRDMSLRDLGTSCGLSYSFIASLEKGRFNPSRESIYQLSEALRVNVNELLPLAGFLPDDVTKDPTGQDISPIELSNLHDNMRSHQEMNVEAPIVAEIACGEPMYTEDSILGWFPVNPLFANVNDGPYVWVKAKGDSMIDVRIFDGSLVLLRVQSHVDSGDIAAVCIDSETATLKRVYFLADGVMLSPENPNMKSTTYDPERIRIVGKAMTVVSDLM